MTATPIVLAALRQSGLQLEAQAFLAAITEGEGGVSFTVLYSGGVLLDPNPEIADHRRAAHVGRQPRHAFRPGRARGSPTG